MTRTPRPLNRIPGASQLATLFRSSLFLVLLLAPLGSAAAGPAAAQEPTKDEVEALAVVYRLFDGMRARDRATLEWVFHEKARLMSAGVRDGAPTVGETPIDGFIESIVTSEGAVLDERLYSPEVRVDGNLATVWVEYDFFRGDEFSHCGYDAFQLAMTSGGWKIIQITDTRRREGCPNRG
jgi:hypothetical protein